MCDNLNCRILAAYLLDVGGPSTSLWGYAICQHCAVAQCQWLKCSLVGWLTFLFLSQIPSAQQAAGEPQQALTSSNHWHGALWIPETVRTRGQTTDTQPTHRARRQQNSQADRRAASLPQQDISEVAQWLACWAHSPEVRGSKPRFANCRRAPHE